MSRIQLALRVADLEASIAFYSELFGADPAKRREGYANFAVTEPPLKLVLIEGETGADTRLDHLGVEVASTEEVNAATTRLKGAGLDTLEENDTSCCYALQDKVWVTGPGKEPWEVYAVKGRHRHPRQKRRQCPGRLLRHHCLLHARRAARRSDTDTGRRQGRRRLRLR